MVVFQQVGRLLSSRFRLRRPWTQSPFSAWLPLGLCFTMRGSSPRRPVTSRYNTTGKWSVITGRRRMSLASRAASRPSPSPLPWCYWVAPWLLSAALANEPASRSPLRSSIPSPLGTTSHPWALMAMTAVHHRSRQVVGGAGEHGARGVRVDAGNVFLLGATDSDRQC